MNRWLKLLAICAGVVVALIAASGLLLRSIVNGSGKDRVVASLGAKLGAPVSVGSVNFDLKQWFHLRPAIALNDVAIGNPPGFSNGPLLQAKKISAQVALAPLLHRRIEVDSIQVDQPQITVENDKNGNSNVEALVKKASGGGAGANSAPSESKSQATLAVEKFTVTSGTLTLGQTEGLAVHDINLEVSGFSNDRSCRLQGSARMFGNESNVKLDGRAGPFSSASLPFEGTVSVVVAPAEIPAGIRREQFGNLLMSPGAKARATLDASVRGDIYGSVGGPATVALTNVLLGPHPSHLLPISGKAPATFSARNLMSNAQFQIGIVSATMQLGNGQWSGSAAVSKQDGVIKTASRGAIRDIDINQLLSAFTTASGKVYGVLAIPSYSLEMSGRNADALRNSLRGGGKLSVTHGRLGTVDLPGTLERVLGQQRSADAIRGATAFDTLTSDLSIGGARINVENLVLDGSALRLTGSGVIGFDQSINFNLNARVTGGLARLVNTGPLRLPSPNADIPLTVTGTVESPQVHPQVGKLAKSAAEGILRNFIKKKLK